MQKLATSRPTQEHISTANHPFNPLLKCFSDPIELITIRLTFLVTNCPNKWYVISENVTDLANDILSFSDWDPEDLPFPIQKYILKDTLLPDDVDFYQALQLIVQIPQYDLKFNIYIDDTTTCYGDISRSPEIITTEPDLVINTIRRPLNSQDPTDYPRWWP